MNAFEKFLGNNTPNKEGQFEEVSGSPETNQLLVKIEGLIHASAIPANQKEAVIRLIEDINRDELEEEAVFLLKTQANQGSVARAAVTLLTRKFRSLKNSLESLGDTSSLSQLIEEIDVEASGWSDV